MSASGIDGLSPYPPDPILALIGMHAADPRAGKIDLGVGVYRDADGNTPVFAAVKEAEQRLVAAQQTKTYLGPAGNVGFNAAIADLLFGPQLAAAAPMAAIQVPGGTAALRLAAELIVRAAPQAALWMGTPAYPNHAPIFQAAGVALKSFEYFDVARQCIPFEAMLEALKAAPRGDFVLLHGSCHNPTGADLSLGQWRALTELLLARGLIPLIDVAYHGLGAGLEEDIAGARHLLAAVGQAMVTYSCSKTFGLYRERTGALFVRTQSASAVEAISSHLAAAARVSWSLPPDHGAEVVRIILNSPLLYAQWHTELKGMAARMAELRTAIAAGNPLLAGVARQAGLFSMLPLGPEEVRRLREEYAIYMTGAGRINVAGMPMSAVPRFLQAFNAIKGG